jgi:hypothetical protein
MVKWLNHVTIAAPRNGTLTHTIDPAASATVVAGAAFTPTAGRFLVCVAGGAVTSTTPAGWTLPAGGSAINNAGVYLWYRTAAGGDTFTTTHNASNYPVVFDIYEFPATTAFIGVSAAGNVASGGAGPSLGGLTASATLRCAVACQDINAAVAPTYTWSVGTEAVDTSTVLAGTDGYGYSLAYVEDSAAASFSSAATSTVGSPTIERLVFALNVPASGTNHAATGAIPVSTAAVGTSALRASAAGAIVAVSAVLGAAAALHAASGVVPVTSTAAGAPAVQQAVAGTALAVSAALGAPAAVHPATGTVTALTEALGTATEQGGPQEHPAFGEAVAVSGVSGTAVTVHSGLGTIPVTVSVGDAAAALHPAAGTTSSVTAAAAAPVVIHSAEGSVVALTEALGTASVAPRDLSATGTVTVTTSVFGTTDQRHAATGTIAITSSASGTAFGGRPMLVTDQCGWDVEPCECTALDTLRTDKPELAAAVEGMAARHLFKWTGSRFAPCPVTVRPCRTDCRSAGQLIAFGGQYGHPVLWQGLGCACGGQDSCSCNNICQIELTGPVMAIDEIWIDGVLLPPTAYRVDNGKYLVRTDGECWPECNDISRPYMVVPDGPGEEAVLGTWAVTYRHGLPIPVGGPEMAGVLACEIAKAICNDRSCALPTRVREITREGITIAMLDDFTGLSEGMTGIWLVDSWITTNRPGRPSHFSVWSPETRERGRTT